TQPFAAMAIALTVLGMLLFFGSQGLPDAGFRAFTTPSMFRPTMPSTQLLTAGASGRLDAVALDAMAGTDYQAAEPPAGRRSPRWFSQRPW
ncbi:MAG: hypothetical protein M3326_13825, partial [Actinomycetota bacterium]|nr:hypothetical protein [Actinomycetota bacterium]